ncbi:TRAP transporter large permease subunit [candidate division KSB1 bacterium]|nr:TRAP transporter large permease subunit [candidate division KSB1 bacterium]
MPLEFYVLLVMLTSFALAVFLGKFPIGVSLALSSIIGALVAGFGFPLRHLVEGTFAYLDPILIITSAMIFMEIIKETGALGEISRLIIIYLHNRPFWMLSLITLFIMFPGMITGLSTAAVLTTGAIVAPALMRLGIPRVQTGSIIAMASLFGMIAPPINVPVMIIGGGVDMPYIGFELPLLFASLPLAIITTTSIGYRYVKSVNIEKIKKDLPESQIDKHGFRLFLPILILIIFMLVTRLIPGKYTALGMPLIFAICCLSAFKSGKAFNYYKVTKRAIKNAMPVMGILVGIGIFIQIMTLTGVRGFLIVKTVQLPSFWLYVGIVVSLPIFGAISSYGASYVLGVPFLLALLGKSEIIVASGLTLIASLGDLMPPTALAGIFAAQVVGESNYFRILKNCLPYAAITALYGIGMILLANVLAKFLIL